MKDTSSFGSIKFINLFLLGVIVYSVGSGLLQANLIHPIICNLFQLVGICMILISSVFIVDFTIHNLYLRTVYYLYLFYLITIVFRGFEFNYEYIKEALFTQWFGVLIYFAPLVLLIPINIELIKRLFTATKLFAVLFLFFLLITAPVILSGSHEGLGHTEFYSRTFGITSGFLLLTFPLHSRNTIFLALTTIMAVLLIAVYHGRRGLALYCGIILIFAAIIYFFKGKNISIVLVIALMFISFLPIVGFDDFGQSKLFSRLSSRGLEDTRTNVEERFYQDMKPIDWIIGKGINGEYYSPGIVWGDGEPSVYRSIIETDYLQIILKGGLISLGLLFMILIPAGIIGIINSNNLLSKAAGLWILIGIINMYPSTVNTFTFNYLLIWFSVAICFSPYIRKLSNNELLIVLRKNQ